MITDEDMRHLASLEAGHCSRAKAKESNCKLCKPRYEAVDRLKAKLEEQAAEIERLEGLCGWDLDHETADGPFDDSGDSE